MYQRYHTITPFSFWGMHAKDMKVYKHTKKWNMLKISLFSKKNANFAGK